MSIQLVFEALASPVRRKILASVAHHDCPVGGPIRRESAALAKTASKENT